MLTEYRKNPKPLTFDQFCAKYQKLYDIPQVDYLKFRDIWTKKQKEDFNNKLHQIGIHLNPFLDIGTFQGESCTIVNYTYLSIHQSPIKYTKMLEQLRIDFIRMIETEFPSLKCIDEPDTRTKKEKYQNPFEKYNIISYGYNHYVFTYLFQEKTTGYLLQLVPTVHYSDKKMGPVMTVGIAKIPASPKVKIKSNYVRQNQQIEYVSMWNCIENIKAYYEKYFFRPYNPNITDFILSDELKHKLQQVSDIKHQLYQEMLQKLQSGDKRTEYFLYDNYILKHHFAFF